VPPGRDALKAHRLRPSLATNEHPDAIRAIVLVAPRAEFLNVV
jgi:hypothetical protein